MVNACKSWFQYYHYTDKIDVLKDTIGLPSIARRRIYEAASKFPVFMGFSLRENSHQNLEKLIADNTFGGPSIIFTRYHKAGKTQRISFPNQTKWRMLGPLCYKLITIVNCYLEAGLTCFVYSPKALYLIIFICGTLFD